jgi:hypothetical protein
VLNDIVSTASRWAGSDAIPKASVFARLNADSRVLLNHLLLSPQQNLRLAPPLLAAARGEAESE